MSGTIDFGKLTIDVDPGDDIVTYTFRGDVDENFRQKEVPRIAKEQIVFVLEGINTFNSCGIREWIYLIRDLSELGQLRFERCSITMIDQINMVPDSLGNGRVESFFAPYFCEDHGEVNRLIDVQQHLESLHSRQAPEFSCEQCQATLEFDALEESYFLFAEGGLSNAS